MDKNKHEQEKPKKRFSPFLLIRLLGIILFVYILISVDLRSLWENMREVKINYLLYAIVFQILLLFLKAFRWHILNSGRKDSYSIIRSLGEFFESYAIGVITPGRMGELVKAGHAKEKNSMMETGIRVMVERGFDLGIFVVLAGVALSITFQDKAAWLIGLLTIIAGLSILIMAIIFMRSAKATALIQKILNRIPFLKLETNLSFRKRSGIVQLSVILIKPNTSVSMRST